MVFNSKFKMQQILKKQGIFWKEVDSRTVHSSQVSDRRSGTSIQNRCTSHRRPHEIPHRLQPSLRGRPTRK